MGLLAQRASVDPVREPPARARAAAVKDAQRLAETLWRGRGFPVDAFWIAERLGIVVVEARLSSQVSSGLVKLPGEDPKLVLNYDDSPSRQRYCCAYHLGDFAGRRGDVNEYAYEAGRDIFASPRDTPEQAYAAAFADELLMPADEVRSLVRHGWTELDLPLRFGVPREVVQRRLKALGIG
jgi:Zn-dependent peptidase ImmA (M78 family)